MSKTENTKSSLMCNSGEARAACEEAIICFGVALGGRQLKAKAAAGLRLDGGINAECAQAAS